MVQLVYNRGDMKVKQIINMSSLSDKETADIISKLLKTGYLVLEELI